MPRRKSNTEECSDGKMYSKLMGGFTKAVSKIKGARTVVDNPAEPDVMYPTGFLSLDYLNGTIIHVETETMSMAYNAIGIVDGSSNTFISRPGCGKSTFCIQSIGKQLKAFPEAMAFIDDIEGSLPMPRKEFLLDLPKEELDKRVKFRNKGITTENVFIQIQAIFNEKVNNREDYLYDTGCYDTFGERIYKLYPTFYFIDSFAMLMPDDILEKDELDGGMGATQTAKKNTQLIKKMSQLLKEANIVMYVINHIMEDVQSGPFKKQAQIDGLKDGERISGGRTALFLANNMIRFDQSKTLKETEEYGIAGTIVDATIVKTRTNINKRKVPLVFNKTEGRFDEELSLLHLIKTEGRLSGAGAYMYLENCPEIKFAQKNFKTILHQNEDLQRAFVLLCREILEGYLSDTRREEAENGFDINSAILAPI